MCKTYVICYDLKLGSGYNSGKDLSKNKGNDQLVKCKDTEMYLLYIYHTWVYESYNYRERVMK